MRTYVDIRDVIRLIAETPHLQDWRTYSEYVSELQKQYPKTPIHVLYGLCKRCRNSVRFDSVKLGKTWYIKFIR